MSWRVAKSLDTLRNQVNTLYPQRSKSDDGTIGDEAHQATHSEHNPDEHGVVRAMDITNDPAHGPVSRKLAEAIVASRDPRMLYVISNREICSSQVNPWQWRPYYGSNAHDRHMHISVVSNPTLYDSTADWKLPFGSTTKPPTPPPTPSTNPIPNLPWASGKGSWYSQYNGKYHWRDTGDAPGSNALGVPDDAQGISFYRHDTLGHWFEVRYPNGQIQIEQQTEIGPAPWTHRLIDISSTAAERAGYSPNNFPTDVPIYWRSIDTPESVRGLTPKQQAAKYWELRKPK